MAKSFSNNHWSTKKKKKESNIWKKTDELNVVYYNMNK